MRFFVQTFWGLIICAYSLTVAAQVEAPFAYLEFLDEKVYIIDDNPVSFAANIYIGSAVAPAKNLYTVAFDVVFPAHLTRFEATTFIYNSNAFLGERTQVIIRERRELSKGRLNITISRTDGKQINGFGEIGRMRFITMSDIIGSRATEEIPFNAKIENVQLFDANGQRLPVETDQQGDTVLIVNDILARNIRVAERDIELYPNPAHDRLYLNLYHLQGQQVEIFDLQGRRMTTAPIRSERLELSTALLSPGIYLVRIRAKEGVFLRRITVE